MNLDQIDNYSLVYFNKKYNFILILNQFPINFLLYFPQRMKLILFLFNAIIKLSNDLYLTFHFFIKENINLSMIFKSKNKTNLLIHIFEFKPMINNVEIHTRTQLKGSKAIYQKWPNKYMRLMGNMFVSTYKYVKIFFLKLANKNWVTAMHSNLYLCYFTLQFIIVLLN